MKKQIAFGIAGASATLIAGFRIVQGMSERGEATDPVAVAPGMPVDPASEPAPDPNPTPTASSTPDPVTPESPAPPSKGATKAELYETARDLEIEGRSKMNKDELLVAIEAAS